MNKDTIIRLRSLPIEEVAGRLGLSVNRHKCLCPFHDDHHASLSFCTSRNTFRCFVCGASGGTIDLTMRYLGKSFPEACRWLADRHNVVVEERNATQSNGSGSDAAGCGSAVAASNSAATASNSAAAASNSAAQKPAFDAARYARYFEHPWLSDKAREFLFTERRLDERVVRWCRLSSWTDREGTHWLQIPYFDVEGRLIGIQYRNLDYRKPDKDSCHTNDKPDKKDCSDKKDCHTKAYNSPPYGGGVGALSGCGSAPRFRFPYGSRCSIYNLPVTAMLRPGEPLYITEGASDCWAMLSAGHKTIAIPSATLLGHDDKLTLKGLEQRLGTTFHMYPDRDAPGERLFMQLKEVLPTLEHHQLPVGCKDVGEWYASQ